ncbi:MAG: PEGA domain-containing protein [Polyangiaceae bacterium]|nr:PEGA domain-containing protein [Polyangiaceae bacterium]MCB9608880.1 PEGA domain-containing protein [Polyangiaceae bacterium]
MGRVWGLGALFIACACLLTVASPSIAYAAGNPVYLVTKQSDAEERRQLFRVAARFRRVVSALPLPPPERSTVQEANLEARRRAIELALKRARNYESEARFDACVREAARVLSEATTVLALSGHFEELRDLHIQIGACLVTAGQLEDARPHFLAAATFDEKPPKVGLHREDVEREQLKARDDVLKRARGMVRIESDPPGAEVWIDGRKQRGKTPLNAKVRLGDHFVTLRRFRFELLTERILLQPSGRVQLSMEVARPTTLAAQLVSGKPRAASTHEKQLAVALWSRAEDVLELKHLPRRRIELSLWDAASGKRVRHTQGPAKDLEALACRVLGESCREETGVPWYVWPLAGAVVVGGTVATIAVARSERDLKFCPPRGCN